MNRPLSFSYTEILLEISECQWTPTSLVLFITKEYAILYIFGIFDRKTLSYESKLMIDTCEYVLWKMVSLIPSVEYKDTHLKRTPNLTT